MGGGDAPGGGGLDAAASPAALYAKILHDPKMRDPRGYIMPSDQPDFPTATRFINALLKSGITVKQASAAFAVAGKNYPAGSYVVKTAQAFRPFVRDMFEPQDHPRDDLFPGGPPIPPYDIAGWTLAMQMGVEYDRVLDNFDGPFTKLKGLQKPMPRERHGTVESGRLSDQPSQQLFVHAGEPPAEGERRSVLAEGRDEGWRRGCGRGRDLGSGFRRGATRVAQRRERFGRGGVCRGASAQGRRLSHPGSAHRLYDQYGGSMPSGWTRWLFEQYEFPFEVVYPQTLDAGNLKSRFDVLVFPDGAMRGGAGGRGGGGGGRGGAAPIRRTFPKNTAAGWDASPKKDRSADQTVCGVGRRGSDGGQFHQHGRAAGRAFANALTEKGADGTGTTRCLAISSIFPAR